MTVFDGNLTEMIAAVLRSQPRKREFRLVTFRRAQKHENAPRTGVLRACACAPARRAHRRSPAAADVDAWRQPKTANLATPDAPTSQNRRSARGRAPKDRNETERTGGFNQDSGRNDRRQILRDHSRNSLACFAAIGALLRSFLFRFIENRQTNA